MTFPNRKYFIPQQTSQEKPIIRPTLSEIAEALVPSKHIPPGYIARVDFGFDPSVSAINISTEPEPPAFEDLYVNRLPTGNTETSSFGQLKQEIDRMKKEAQRHREEEIRQLTSFVFMQPPTISRKVPKELPSETVVAPVVGWRKWHAPLFGNTLKSVVKTSVEWPKYQKLESFCERPTCGGLTCLCGIYAYKERSESELNFNFSMYNSVLGQVNLWGAVVDCERGYRAQFAYPKAFVDTGFLAQRYAREYGVPLIK